MREKAERVRTSRSKRGVRRVVRTVSQRDKRKELISPHARPGVGEMVSPAGPWRA